MRIEPLHLQGLEGLYGYVEQLDQHITPCTHTHRKKVSPSGGDGEKHVCHMSRSHGVILANAPVTSAQGTARRWCFTLNNPEGLISVEDCEAWGARYVVYQEEVGESGTHHLQGYVEMNKPVRFTHFKGLEGAHFEKAVATKKAADYCKKSETSVGEVFEYGSMGAQGVRTDILALRDSVRSGKRGRDLFDDDSTVGAAVKFSRAVDKMVECYSKPPDRANLRVVFHYGPAGTGKSHCAHADGAYYFDGNNGFWNGYAGEKHIIFDEFGGHCLTPLMFQRVCDVYPLNVNVKGGSYPFYGTDIHITSNYLPSRWWNEKTKYNEQAVYRRIHVVHYHDKYGHYVLFESDGEGLAMDKLASYLAHPPPINVIV
nr:MAG: replication associated protein [Cressdnaviricota sp.]